MHRCVSERELAALYCAADVMLVTPLRDGMNLVAKEFAAARTDDDGVLVLSEFAGAAAELEGALVVNPYDVDAVAASIHRALVMTPDERAARMRRLRRRVTQHDVHAWAAAFLSSLQAARDGGGVAPPAADPGVLAALGLGRAKRCRLLLDYDGTLVPLARSPELAAPDAELMQLLEGLCALPNLDVEIVSGRPREPLERWFGRLPLALWAEHGFWWRARPGTAWVAATAAGRDWMARVRPILQQFTDSTPGATIEEKSACIAWHFRNADPEFGARQAHELRMLLGDALSNQPFEVLEGKKVIEVRLRGISKATVAHRLAADGDQAIVALGDDRTDEDLFRGLPSSAITVAVGQQPSVARYAVADYRGARQLLAWLFAARASASLETDPAAAALASVAGGDGP
jgi:trehalose 6-phosphate synthase/phosphatase